MRRIHWFDFTTTIIYRGVERSVKVEATISESHGEVEIEGVKVKLANSNLEIVPSDDQMKEIRREIYAECDNTPDDPKDDWRNQW